MPRVKDQRDELICSHTALCLLDAATEVLQRAEREGKDSYLARSVWSMVGRIDKLQQRQLKRYEAAKAKLTGV